MDFNKNTMISKNKAIEILEDYLYYEFAVDPLCDIVMKAHIASINENKYCWVISECNEKERDEKMMSGTIGGGPYFIDKEDGRIYGTGSAPLNWMGNFINYKEGKKSHIDWKEKKHLFLNSKQATIARISYEKKKITCRFDSKNKALELFFKSISIPMNTEFPMLIENKPFGLEEGELVIGLNGVKLDKKVKIVYLDFRGGIEIFHYNNILRELKKYCRINKFKEINKIWITVLEKNLNQPFKNWLLRLNLEIK